MAESGSDYGSERREWRRRMAKVTVTRKMVVEYLAAVYYEIHRRVPQPDALRDMLEGWRRDARALVVHYGPDSVEVEVSDE